MVVYVNFIHSEQVLQKRDDLFNLVVLLSGSVLMVVDYYVHVKNIMDFSTQLIERMDNWGKSKEFNLNFVILVN